MTRPGKSQRKATSSTGKSPVADESSAVKPVTVPFSATPRGELPEISDWAQPLVWTDRMLTTLRGGVRGGKWHTLIDKVYSPDNLFYAARRVVYRKGAAGVDHQTTEDFSANDREELHRLHEQLRTDTYRPAAVRRTWIPKPGSSEKRPLGPGKLKTGRRYVIASSKRLWCM